MKKLQLFFALALFGLAANAQTDRGVITGTVQDSAGAVVAGVPVTAQNNETGAVYPTSTTATGNFTLTALPAGGYELAVEAPGFRKYVRQRHSGASGPDGSPGYYPSGRRRHRVGNSDHGIAGSQDGHGGAKRQRQRGPHQFIAAQLRRWRRRSRRHAHPSRSWCFLRA